MSDISPAPCRIARGQFGANAYIAFMGELGDRTEGKPTQVVVTHDHTRGAVSGFPLNCPWPPTDIESCLTAFSAWVGGQAESLADTTCIPALSSSTHRASLDGGGAKLKHEDRIVP